MSNETVVMRQEAPTFGYLIVKKGLQVGAIFQLREMTTIGRRPGVDVWLDDVGVSNDHARVRLNETREFVLIDLGSTNGTFINGQPAHQQALSSNDIIAIGAAELVFKRVSER